MYVGSPVPNLFEQDLDLSQISSSSNDDVRDQSKPLTLRESDCPFSLHDYRIKIPTVYNSYVVSNPFLDLISNSQSSRSGVRWVQNRHIGTRSIDRGFLFILHVNLSF